MIYYTIFLTILININFVESRPLRPPLKEGEIRNCKGQTDFKFDNSKKLDEQSNKNTKLKYNVKLSNNCYSLDDDNEVEIVECQEKSLDIYTTVSKITQWKEKDVLYGSEMWKCYYPISRKIIFIEYEGIENGLFHYFIRTENFQIEKCIQNGSIYIEFPNDNSHDKNENDENNMKENCDNECYKYQNYTKQIQSKLISPTERTLIDTSEPLEIKYEIIGCTKKKCGEISTNIEVIVYGNLIRFEKDIHYHLCKCQRSNCLCSTTLYFTDSIYRNLTHHNKEYTKIQFGMTFSPSIKQRIIPKFESKFFEINTYRMIFTSPSQNEMLQFGNTILFKWKPTQTLLNRFENMTLSIYKHIERENKTEEYLQSHNDDKIFIQQYHMKLNQKKFSLTIQNSKITKGDVIFGIVNFTDEFHSESIETNFISILSNTSIQILTPDIMTYYNLNISEIRVNWTYTEKLNFTKINVVLFQQSFFKKLKLQRVKQIDVTLNTTTIPVSNLSLTPASNYFIRISYRLNDTKLNKKRIVFSDFFSIGIKRSFEITTKIEEKTKTINVHYIPKENIGNFYVSIHEKRPILSDKQIDKTSKELIKDYQINESKVLRFKYKHGSIFKQYVLIKYNCILSSYFCTEERYWFKEDVPFPINVKWNYNTETHKSKQEEIEILNVNCQKNIFQHQNTSNILSNLCSKYLNVPFKISMKTKNSYVYIPIKVHGFELYINNFELYKARCYLQADINLDIDLRTIIHGHFGNNITIPLSKPIPFELNIPVGPIIISVGFFLTPKIGLKIEADAMAMITWKYKKHFNYNLIIDTLNSSKPVVTQIVDYTKNENPKTSFHGLITTTIEPFFQISFILKFGLYYRYSLSLNLDLNFGLQIKSKTRYPPFQPKKQYSSIPFLMKLKYGPHLYLQFHLETKRHHRFYFEYEIIPPKFIHKCGLFKIQNTSKLYSFSFKNQTNLNTIEMIEFQNEIGKLTQKIYPGFNPYDLILLRDKVHQSLYNVVFLDQGIDDEILKTIKNCILGFGCLKKIGNEEFYFIPPSPIITKKENKETIISCILPYCLSCSLDESYCEKCENGYELNNMKLCIPIGSQCNSPNIYVNGQCIHCEGKTVYNFDLQKCVECPEGFVYNDGKCNECDETTIYDKITKTCIHCEPNKYAKKGKCVECKVPKVMENGECNYCSYPKGYLNGNCVTCEKEYHLNDHKCEKCNEGTYYNYDTKECVDCKDGYISKDRYRCIYCDINQEFNTTYETCQYCLNGYTINIKTKKCEKCPEFYHSENGYCEYCDGILSNNKCYPCSSERKVVNDNHTECISCQKKFPGSGYFEGNCIICEEGYMINNNGICEKCPEKHINYLGKCIQCPKDSIYSEKEKYCYCTNPKKWFNGKKCVYGNKIGMEFNKETNQLQCKKGYGMMYIYDKYQCMKCEEYGFELKDGICVCQDENYFLYYDKCLQCTKDLFGVVFDEIDKISNDTFVHYKKCDCEGERGWKEVDGYLKCVTCKNHTMTKINGFCECKEGNGRVLLRNGYCVDCKEIGGNYSEDNENIICKCPDGKGFLINNYDVNCVKCEDYNQENVNGYCVCGGYHDRKAGILQNDGKCLSCKKRGGKVIKDSRGYYHCVCSSGKVWDINRIMCINKKKGLLKR